MTDRHFRYKIGRRVNRHSQAFLASHLPDVSDVETGVMLGLSGQARQTWAGGAHPSLCYRLAPASSKAALMYG